MYFTERKWAGGGGQMTVRSNLTPTNINEFLTKLGKELSALSDSIGKAEVKIIKRNTKSSTNKSKYGN